MSVDLTQDEMNILNLNGISAEDAKANVDMMRASGMDDNAIKSNLMNTIQQLKPITKTSVNDTGNIKKYQEQGPITPYEAGERMFQGHVEYNNVSKYAGYTEKQKAEAIEADKKREEYYKELDEKYNQKIKARNERVNNGTASFMDRVGAFLDRIGNNAVDAAYNTPAYTYDATAKMAGIDNNGNIKFNIDKTKPIGFNESLYNNGIVNGAWIPFAGGFISKADEKSVLDIKNKILQNKEIQPSELNFLNYMIDKQQEEQVRGYSIGGSVAQSFLPSLIRFGTEMMAGGWVAKGIAAKLGMESVEGAAGYKTYQGLRAAGAGKKASLLGGKVAKGLTDMGVTGAINTVLPTTWNDTYENFIDKKYQNEIQISDTGEILFSQAKEAPAKTFVKSLGTTFATFASEASGGLLGIPLAGVKGAAAKYALSPISKYVLENPKLTSFVQKTMPALSKAYEKINGLPITGKSRDWLKSKVKFDGLLEEMGEESVESLLDLALGTDGEERNFKNLCKAVFKSPDEWAVIAGASILQGGSLSLASHLIGSNMEKNGATDEQILDTLDGLSEEDKVQAAFNLMGNGEVNVDMTPDEQEAARKVEEAQQVKEEFSANMKKGGVDNTTANSAADFFVDRISKMGKASSRIFRDLKNIMFTNKPLNEAINSVINKDNEEYTPEQILDDFDELQEQYANGEISEDEMEQAMLDFEEYATTHPEINTAITQRQLNKDNVAITQRQVRNNNIAQVQSMANEVKAAIESGNLPTKQEAQKYAEAGHQKLTDIIMKAKELYAANKRSNTAINKKNKKQQQISDNPTLVDAVNNLADYNKGKVNEEFKSKLLNLSYEINDYLDSIGAMELDENEVMFQKASSAGADGDIAAAKKEWNEKGTESKYFKKWFGDSKVVDENGKPLVMYHGTPNAGFEEFRDNSHFTSNKDYANIYQNQGASSLSYKKTADNPDTYSVYLSIKNPFDTRDAKARDIFLNEYQAYYSPELTDRGMLDWMEVEDLTEWLKENHPEYDGIIADEGGTGGYGDEVKSRGISYIPFSPEQIKSVDNQGTFDSENPNIYFQENYNDKMSEEDNKGFINFVNKVFGGKLSKQEKSRSYIIGKTPEILKEAGISDNEISVSYKIIEKAYNGKNDGHKLDQTTINKVYEALYHPIAVIKGELNKNEISNNRYGVIVDLKNNDNYILVSIESDKKTGNTILNDIRSIHSRESFLPMLQKAVNENRLLKLKKSKMKDLLNHKQSDQMSEGATSLMNSINQKYKNSKVLFQNNQSNNGYVTKVNRIIQGVRNLFITNAKGNEIVGTELTMKQMMQKIPELNSITYFLKDLQDVKFKLVKNLRKGATGKYDHKTNTVYVVENERTKQFPVTYLATVIHELEHAHQYKELAKYKKKLKQKNISEADQILYNHLIDNIKATQKYARINTRYKKSHQEEIDFAYQLRKQNRLDLPRFKNYKEIYIQNLRNYNNYKYSIGEVDAEFAKVQILDQLGLGEQYDRENFRRGIFGNDRSRIYRRVDNGTRNDRKRSDRYFKGHFQNLRTRHGINTFYQSAYNGSPSRFNEFSTDYIGSGEGNAAHGWGLYFAKNKEISEGYRLRLSPDVTYNGEVPDNRTQFNIKNIQKFGKDKWIELRNKDLQNAIDNNDYIKNELKTKKLDGKTKQILQEALSEGNNVIEAIQNDINISQSIDLSKVGTTGQLYQVDIPEEDVLLDEDKDIKEQPQKVQDALYSLLAAEKIPYEYWKGTGKQIYETIKKAEQDPYEPDKNLSKAASLKLNEYGIKGITYDGRQDGRCYVIFDDKAVKILQTYYQEDEQDFDPHSYESIKNHLDAKRERDIQKYNGYFTQLTPDKDLIGIVSQNNPSTIMHELGHWYLKTLEKYADIDPEVQRQYDELCKWLGHTQGEQFTEAEQERFARTFEAYLYRGKAPTSRLRQVFENFKQWLRQVYSRIEDLEEKGADISDEAREVFDRVFYGDQVVEDKKKSAALLSKVRNVVAELPEWAKKENTTYNKDAEDEAYRIVAAASGKSEKYLRRIFAGRKQASNKILKDRENISKLIEERVAAGDVLSVGDNNISGWSYAYYVEANDIEATGDGGAELAERAFEDLSNHNFEIIVNNSIDNYLDDADAQYNYLLDRFKETSKDDVADERQRSIVLGAFLDWVESVPDEYQQTYTDKFMADTTQIERRENIDKFEKVKNDIIQKAKETRQYSNKNVEAFRQEVINILRGLKFLTSEDKARLLVNILETPNNNFLEARINSIVDIAHTMSDISYRKDLMEKIDDEIKATKNIKQGARTVGKYDYTTNKIFEELRDMNKMTVEKANEVRLARLEDTEHGTDAATAEDAGYSFVNKIINEFLTYKANGTQYADTDQIKRLYDDIIKIKLAGKDAKSERELIDKLNNSQDVEELVQILSNKKDAKGLTKTYINWFGNAESTLNALFNKHISEKYGSAILQAETDAMVWIYQKRKQFEEEVAKIFNLPKWNFDSKIIENLATKITVNEFIKEYDVNGDVLRSRVIPKEMNKMEIILAWMWNMNPVLSKRLENQFGEDGLDQMFEVLNEQDKQLGALMIKTVNDFYPEVNEMFIKKYGLDMPKVQCYFPSTPERAASEIDLLNEYNQQGMNTGFTKQRSQSETLTMSFHNPIQTLYSHIDGVGKFIKMTDILDKSNKVLKDKAVKRLITNKYGKEASATLIQILANVSYKAKAATYSGMNQVFNNLIQNWVQGNVILRPIVGLKQLLSANNYAVDMPYMVWQMGFLKALSHPKKTIDYMMSIPYIQARFGGNYSNEFLQQAIENSKFAKTKKLKDYLSLNIKLGDIGAIIFGGKPYIDYLISQGKTEKEAIDLFILSTQRSQQSSAVSSLSNMQVAANNNPITKIFTAYKNSPQQYMRMVGDAIVSVANGDMTKKQCAKVLFQYLYIQPLFYTMAGSGSLLTLLLAGDDDDLIKDLLGSIFNLNSSAIPILGDVYNFAINKLILKNNYLPQTTPMLSDIQKAIQAIAKEDVTLEDWLNFVGMGIHMGTGVNGKAVFSMASALGDLANGDIAEATLKAIGYTKARAKHIAGDD